MNKANPFRLTTILAVFIIALITLWPNRSTDISKLDPLSPAITVTDTAKAFSTKHYSLKAKASGNVGESEDLNLQLINDKNEVLKDDINVGDGYTPGKTISLGSNLPSISLAEGSLRKDSQYNISFIVDYINLGLDLVGGSEIVYEIPMEMLSETKGNINDVIKIIGSKLDSNGLKELYIQAVGQNRILIQLPGLKKSEVEQIKKQIETQGKLEFSTVITDESIVERARKYEARGKKLPLPNFPYKFVYRKAPNAKGVLEPIQGSEVLIESNITVSGQDISHAYRGLDNQSLSGSYAIHIKFNSKGANKFGKLTERIRGKQLAIILDGALQSYPNVNEPILTGDCQITGNFTQEEADNLVTVLRSGSMDVKLDLHSENTVGPTLGSDSISSGINACIVGGILVLCFMLYYYRTLGGIACIALILNLLMLISCMIIGEGTLTLPGIAGFALTIGMAVDATVLIFERLREESENVKQNIKVSLTKGYDKAFITIFDSNFTTFITALILYLVGNSGPVKGFCLSLMLGLAINLFAAVFVTQTLISWAVSNGKLKSFTMTGNISTKSIDFFAIGKKVRPFVSYLVIAVGMFMLITKSDSILDVDFKGGNLLQVDLLESTPDKKIREICSEAGYPKAVVQQFGNLDGTSYTIRTQHLNDEQKQAFQNFLIKESGLKLPTDTSLAFPRDITVGGAAAAEMLTYAVIALIAAMLAILLYIMMRFSEFKYGFGACLALVHDVTFTISVLTISGIKINLTIFAALLTVVGYSLNDTIVIFDRIRENIGAQKSFDFKAIAIKSLNQTLKRTILTSLTTLFVIGALIIAGGGVIKGFAITMLIGLGIGTYSSLFIAVPYVKYLYNKQQNNPESSTPPSEDKPNNEGSEGSGPAANLNSGAV